MDFDGDGVCTRNQKGRINVNQPEAVIGGNGSGVIVEADRHGEFVGHVDAVDLDAVDVGNGAIVVVQVGEEAGEPGRFREGEGVAK